MYDVWQAPDVITAFGTFLAGSAACMGVVVAAIGLNTWKKQLKWQADRELAKSAFVGLKKRHDAVLHVRDPFGWSSETEIDTEDLFEGDIPFKKVEHKYQSRWNVLQEAKRDFYPIELEGDALWGSEFVDLCRELRRLEGELLLGIQDYVESHDPRYASQGFFSTRDEARENRALIHGFGKRDEFGPRYEKAVERIERFLRKKLEQDQS
ncbi:hypothetical protein [Shimia aestuarii]|uniref:hypothetical protein n=1 Tax=Shimia aestuarii TaxID=254406 RepID=UPI001FB4782E|nr:hypothetical protein [Shimia aestuarii]